MPPNSLHAVAAANIRQVCHALAHSPDDAALRMRRNLLAVEEPAETKSAQVGATRRARARKVEAFLNQSLVRSLRSLGAVDLTDEVMRAVAGAPGAPLPLQVSHVRALHRFLQEVGALCRQQGLSGPKAVRRAIGNWLEAARAGTAAPSRSVLVPATPRHLTLDLSLVHPGPPLAQWKHRLAAIGPYQEPEDRVPEPALRLTCDRVPPRMASTSAPVLGSFRVQHGSRFDDRKGLVAHAARKILAGQTVAQAAPTPAELAIVAQLATQFTRDCGPLDAADLPPLTADQQALLLNAVASAATQWVPVCVDGKATDSKSGAGWLRLALALGAQRPPSPAAQPAPAFDVSLLQQRLPLAQRSALLLALADEIERRTHAGATAAQLQALYGPFLHLAGALGAEDLEPELDRLQAVAFIDSCRPYLLAWAAAWPALASRQARGERLLDFATTHAQFFGGVGRPLSLTLDPALLSVGARVTPQGDLEVSQSDSHRWYDFVQVASNLARALARRYQRILAADLREGRMVRADPYRVSLARIMLAFERAPADSATLRQKLGWSFNQARAAETRTPPYRHATLLQDRVGEVLKYVGHPPASSWPAKRSRAPERR